MPQRYQFPCPSCSKVLLITTSQAGETLTCSCGATVDVPTLREIRQLDTAADEAPTQRPAAWNPTLKALFVAGMLMLAFGALGHWRVEPQRSVLVTDRPKIQEVSDEDLENLPLMRAWSIWEAYRDVSLESREITPMFLANRAKHRELSLYLYFFWGLGGVGIILIVASLVLAYSPAKRG